MGETIGFDLGFAIRDNADGTCTVFETFSVEGRQVGEKQSGDVPLVLVDPKSGRSVDLRDDDMRDEWLVLALAHLQRSRKRSLPRWRRG